MSDKLNKLVEEIEKMNAIEIVDLVKMLEEKFGVTAAAPVAAQAAGGAGDAASAEEKTSFVVELKSAGEQKIQVIKALREITGLGLKEAKYIVDQAPKAVKENISKADADEMKKKLEAVGATVEIK